MKNYLISLISVLILCTAFSCEKNNPEDENENNDSNNKVKIIGKGELIDKNIETGSFSELENIGYADISIKKAAVQKITFRAQANILDIMTSEISGNKLKTGIKENYNIETSKGIFINIETPNAIDDFTITGVGNIYLDFEKQTRLDISIIGTGDFNAPNTEIEECEIKIIGTGNCNVFVTKTLDVSIMGVGSVSYKGDAEVSKSIMGVGSVNKR